MFMMMCYVISFDFVVCNEGWTVFCFCRKMFIIWHVCLFGVYGMDYGVVKLVSSWVRMFGLMDMDRHLLLLKLLLKLRYL